MNDDIALLTEDEADIALQVFLADGEEVAWALHQRTPLLDELFGPVFDDIPF